MNRKALGVAAVAALSMISSFASAETRGVVDRLYILNCGEGATVDVSRWTPGATGPRDFVDNCYLIRHGQDWMIWDTGVPDAVADMPGGLPPADPKATRWSRPKKLLTQLADLGVKPADLKYLAVSHTHPDHIGNVELFPQTMLLVQKILCWASSTRPASSHGVRTRVLHPKLEVSKTKNSCLEHSGCQ